MPVITKGQIKRDNKEKQNELIKQEKERKQKLNNNKTVIEHEIMGNYKKIVIDSLVKEFSMNYDDNFDYYSLINSITFKKNKTGIDLSPTFYFNPNGVEFRSDVKEEGREFNENSYTDFITNDDAISGKALDIYYFDNSEEYEEYENGDLDSEDYVNYDGGFVPTISNKDRYSNFNKINKLGGYKPVEQSSKEANVNALKNWDKIKTTLLQNLMKKLKL